MAIAALVVVSKGHIEFGRDKAVARQPTLERGVSGIKNNKVDGGVAFDGR